MNTGVPLDHFNNVPAGTGKTPVMVNPEWWASLPEEQREFYARHELLHAAVRAAPRFALSQEECERVSTLLTDGAQKFLEEMRGYLQASPQEHNQFDPDSPR